jgi:hypothetical protein
MSRERIQELIAEIDRIGDIGAWRREVSPSPNKGLYPCGLDWLSFEERAALSKVQVELRQVEVAYYGDPKERVSLKRELRKRGTEFDKDASIAELRNLVGERVK